MDNLCPFCEVANIDQNNRVILRNHTAIAFRDGFPVSEGHMLIVPVRHVTSFFDITDQEREDLFELLKESKLNLENEFGADSFNIGINDGKHAGQTVFHLHIHLIPRYEGDVAEPRGGVRWIKPDRAVYWED